MGLNLYISENYYPGDISVKCQFFLNQEYHRFRANYVECQEFQDIESR